MAKTSLYRGFWTGAYLQDKKKGFSLSDVELVNRDLMNHIWTAKGERVMMPNFGTRIPLLAFEPLDTTTLEVIRVDLTEVFTYDPRVTLVDLAILPLPDNNAIVAFAELRYNELNVQETIRLEVPVGS